MHARHSAFIRQVRGNSINKVVQDQSIPPTPLKPWVTEAGTNASGSSIMNSSNLLVSVSTQAYSGEDQSTQAQIYLPDLNNNPFITADIATESFDEPLSTLSASSILNSFIAPVL